MHFFNKTPLYVFPQDRARSIMCFYTSFFLTTTCCPTSVSKSSGILVPDCSFKPFPLLCTYLDRSRFYSALHLSTSSWTNFSSCWIAASDFFRDSLGVVYFATHVEKSVLKLHIRMSLRSNHAVAPDLFGVKVTLLKCQQHLALIPLSPYHWPLTLYLLCSRHPPPCSSNRSRQAPSPLRLCPSSFLPEILYSSLNHLANSLLKCHLSEISPIFNASFHSWTPSSFYFALQFFL